VAYGTSITHSSFVEEFIFSSKDMYGSIYSFITPYEQ